MKKYISILVIALFLLSIYITIPARGENEDKRRTIKETLLAKLGPRPDSQKVPFSVSPDLRKVAWVQRGKTGYFISINGGKKSKEYEDIDEDTLRFSHDSKKIAFVAKRGKKAFIVFDGKEHNTYDRILYWVNMPSLINISPDSKRVAYIACRGKKKVAVVDGKEQKEYPGIYEHSLTFSPDSKNIAYSVRKNNRTDSVVLNGKELKAYQCTSINYEMQFSPNSKKLGYFASDRGSMGPFLVINKKEYRRDPGICANSLAWSPNGRRYAYHANISRKDINLMLVINGKGYKKKHQAIQLYNTFSPNSKRYAYFGKSGTKSFLVIDNKQDPMYETLWFVTFTFSPDSKRYAYVAQESDNSFVVVDGKEQKKFARVGITSPAFSPDSKHVAYMTQSREKHPDGFASVVVDGIEGRRFKCIWGNNQAKRVVFDTNNSFHYICEKEENGVYLVEVTLK